MTLRNIIKQFSGAWSQTTYKQCFCGIIAVSLLIIIASTASQFVPELPSSTTVIKQRLKATSRINVAMINVTMINVTVGNVIVPATSGCSLLKAGAKPPSMGKTIPKIFHQTYKASQLPNTYRPYIAKCRNLNPEWQYFLWRDEDIVAFINEFFPQYMRKYRVFTMNVQRADFIRYMVLYHYGGVYLDMDVECVKPFFPDLQRYPAFLDQERKEHSQILSQREFMAMNSAMGSVPGHPFYLRMLESINAAPDNLQGAGITTGPDRLSLVYEEWIREPACVRAFPVTLLDPVILSPIADVKLHNFHNRCKDKPNLAQNQWLKAGCELLTAKDWKVDASDNRTVGKHLFLHMGYWWGPKSPGSFEAKELGPVKLYTVDRMRK